MRDAAKLAAIGLIAGTVLIVVLKTVELLTGNPAYVLLFNFDYIPVVNEWRPVWLIGLLFHYGICVFSAIILFYFLRPFGREHWVSPYVTVYTIGSALLFSLTALSDQPPEFSDGVAWVYWTLAHAAFGWVVGWLIRKWV